MRFFRGGLTWAEAAELPWDEYELLVMWMDNSEKRKR